MLISMWIGLKKHIMTLLFLSLGLLVDSKANGIDISNISLLNHDAVAKTVEIQFDITWQNSWRHPVTSGMPNWDAAWVFGRFSVRGESDWHPMVLTPSADITGMGTMDVVSHPTQEPNGIGAMIYRAGPGSGTFSATEVSITWYYGANNPTIGDFDLLEVRLFGIEMVNIPGGPFYLGSGLNSLTYDSFYQQGTSNQPYRLASSSTVSIGGINELDFAGHEGGLVLATDYPRGLQAFYLMKHELTEQMLTNLLNSVGTGIPNTHIYDQIILAHQSSGSINHYLRRTLMIEGGDSLYHYSSLRPEQPINYLSWEDVASFADWAGLRPYTELEFEKAARGWSYPSSADEFPWRTNQIVSQPYGIIALPSGVSGSMFHVESGYSSGDSVGNAIYASSLNSPLALNVGYFANDTSSRAQSSASLTGVLDLAGNVSETVASIENATISSWVTEHGDGVLSLSGRANQSWPGYDSNTGQVTNTGLSYGTRGGGAEDSKEALWISNRENVGLNPGRLPSSGSRVAMSRSCDLPTHIPANFSVSSSSFNGIPNVYVLSVVPVTVGQAFIWIIEAPEQKVRIIEGQGSANISLAVSESPFTFEVYLHSVNDCGISLASNQITINH